MDLSNYLLMKHEISLLVVILFLLIYDIFASAGARKMFFPIACGLVLINTIISFFFKEEGTAFGGMYVTGPAYTMIKNILNIGVFLILLQAREWITQEKNSHRQGEFVVLTLMTLFGMDLMISSGHFLLFYIGLETASLPLAALVAMDKMKEKSAEAGAKYVFNAIFSSGIFLFGLSFLYGACGTLYYTGISQAMTITPLLVMALIFVLSGLFFKISLVPFHLWAPDTYEGAPTNVTLYLSTISKGAAVFALITILYHVFPSIHEKWQSILWVVILLTMTIGNLFALRQNNMKRFLAFSSISQAGYIMLSVYSGSKLGMAGAVYYIFVYIFSNLAAFGVISAIENKTGKVNMSDYRGLYKTNPKLALTMMIAMFSLGGIPFTAGFFSKMFVFTAAMENLSASSVVLVFLAFLNTIISLYYYLLVVKAMFIQTTNDPIPTLKTDSYLKLSLAVAMIGIAVIGVFSCFFESINLSSFGI